MKYILNSTYIYGLLIFIGYYNYYSYYSCFDIKISSYMTVGELLLSFLPLTIPILSFIGVMAFLYLRVIGEVAINKKGNEITNKEDSDGEWISLFTLKKSYQNIRDLKKDMNWKSFRDILYLFANIVAFIIGVFIYIFFIGFIFHFLNRIFGKETMINISIGELIFYSVFWFLIFKELLNKTWEGATEFVNLVLLFFLLLFSIGLINIDNQEEAMKIINGESNINFEFIYNGNTIKSSDDLVFVGKTEKFIFMRDLKSCDNYIFPIEKVGRIIQKKGLNK